MSYEASIPRVRTRRFTVDPAAKGISRRRHPSMHEIANSARGGRIFRGASAQTRQAAPRCAALMMVTLLCTLLFNCASPTATPTPTSTPRDTPTATAEVLPTATVVRPSPTPLLPGVTGQSYLDTTLGVQLSYPSDWVLSETDEGLVLGTSEKAITGGELVEGAGLALRVEPLPNAEWEDLDELAKDRASVFRSQTMEISDPQPLSVDGQQSSFVTLRGLPPLSQTPVQGMVAVVIWDRWLYSFVGLSVVDEWPTHGPALQAVIQSTHFLAREEPSWDPDPWEPDDVLDEASPLEPGSSQSHDFHSLGDRDYVSFAATRGYTYTLETFNLGRDVDTRIFLYTCDGSLLAQDDDGRALEELWASRLVWAAERTCTHYVMVHDVGEDDAGPGTAYDLRIWEQPHFVEDEYEPDGKPSQATLLRPGELRAHNLHFPGDHDWTRLEAKAGHVYVIETSGLGEGVDTVVHLLDEEGEELDEDDNGREQEEPLASRLRWTAEADGILYVVAHDKEDDAEGEGTQYWIGLTEISP